jgi:hypothetical protein
LKWGMYAPGGTYDSCITARLTGLARIYAPEYICLTHARYHHAADIAGLFAGGDDVICELHRSYGITGDELRKAFDAAIDALNRCGYEKLRELCTQGLTACLDGLSKSNAFTAWFKTRNERHLYAVLQNIFGAVSLANPRVQYGLNAMNPSFDGLCMPSLGELCHICDFVQPLLGYTGWHVLQPLAAWAELFMRHTGFAAHDCIRLAAVLFGLEGIDLPKSISELYNTEGNAEFIHAVLARQLDYLGKPGVGMPGRVMPVIRCEGWQRGVTEYARDEILRRFEGNIAYQ